MDRVLIDTNVWIAAPYNRHSASYQIIEMVDSGELTLIVSPAIAREYEIVIPKAVRSDERRAWVYRVIGRAEQVTPKENPPITEDRADDKFLAAALTGQADAIITNDKHLLVVHPYRGVEILRPSLFLQRFFDKTNESQG